MNKARVVSLLVRLLCFAYVSVSLFAAGYVLVSSNGFQMPASVDPSLTVSPGWLALAIISQAVVMCSFLIATAETLFEPEDVELAISQDADVDGLSIGAKAVFVPSTKQLVA